MSNLILFLPGQCLCPLAGDLIRASLVEPGLWCWAGYHNTRWQPQYLSRHFKFRPPSLGDSTFATLMTLLTLTSPNIDESLSVLHSEPYKNKTAKIDIGDRLVRYTVNWWTDIIYDRTLMKIGWVAFKDPRGHILCFLFWPFLPFCNPPDFAHFLPIFAGQWNIAKLKQKHWLHGVKALPPVIAAQCILEPNYPQ